MLAALSVLPSLPHSPLRLAPPSPFLHVACRCSTRGTFAPSRGREATLEKRAALAQAATRKARLSSRPWGEPTEALDKETLKKEFKVS